jgi:SAM-dependent methyltransferase
VTTEIAARLSRAHARFPRSAGYDQQWLVDHAMGPHPLWLLEWLWPALDLPPGARVLDLGCGTALTSIFLAREYGVDVVAADLWVPPAENWPRIVTAGLAGRVLPLHVEAHDLPFADGYFDAVVSIDAYHYFGTADLYLSYLSRFVAPGGRIAIAVPGLTAEFDDDQVPEHLRADWQPDFWTFHSPAWWRRLWSRGGTVDVEHADLLEDGWLDWAEWTEVRAAFSTDDFLLRFPGMDRATIAERQLREAGMVRRDAGRNLGFTRVVARRHSASQ